MKFRNIAILTLINLFMTVGAFAVPPNDNFANATTLTGVRVTVSAGNLDATKEPNEPNHAANVGGKSVWFKWTAPSGRHVMITTNRSGGNLDTLLNIYDGTSLTNLTSVYYNNNIDSATNLKSAIVLNPVAGQTYYIAVDGYNNGSAAAEGVFQLDIKPYFMYQGADFDMDGMTDLSVFRPASGEWIVNGSTRSFSEHWGANGDIPMIAGRSSAPTMTVFRPSEGMWYLYLLSDNHLYVPYGTNGDIPVADNFGGTLTNPAVFRPSEGMWYIYGFTNPELHYRFGLQGDIPVAGQYTPDQYADIAVFRPSNGVWYFINRAGNNPQLDSFRAVKFGQEGDKPVPADYDGDGRLDIAVYRPSTGTWWVLRSSDLQATTLQWGIAEDIPTTGDFDGDGKFDYAVFRPSEAVWYILQSSDLQTQITQFGQTGDIPMTANKTF